MVLKIFDNHSHLSSDKAYDLDVWNRNIIFNSIEEYESFVSSGKSAKFISIIADINRFNDFKTILEGDKRVIAIKIHSRLQELDEEKFYDLVARLKSIKLSKPIIYDAFFYGPALEHAPRISDIIYLSNEFPELDIVVAHSGGHKILDFFYHLRPLQNIYYDLSNSLTYLQHASVFQDIVHLIRFTPKTKILFGSDFPYCSAAETKTLLDKICQNLELSESEISSIYSKNAFRLFGIDTRKDF